MGKLGESSKGIRIHLTVTKKNTKMDSVFDYMNWIHQGNLEGYL